jgi:hypothetical protein
LSLAGLVAWYVISIETIPVISAWWLEITGNFWIPQRLKILEKKSGNISAINGDHL